MLTQSRLKELLHYDPNTGAWTRIKGVKGRAEGAPVGCVTPYGYLSIGIDCRDYLANRLVWLYMYGKWPHKQLDHINRDRKDNRLCNLRLATNQHNQFNRIAVSHCGFKGVSWQKDIRRWRAKITLNGKDIALGCYGTKEEAALAYNEGAKKYFGEYARLNVVVLA